MPSLIPRSVWARRLVYELVYAWPGSGHATTFNAGLVPVDRDILADSDLAQDASQIQLYAELLTLAKLDDEAWRHAAVVEVAAGCGGGLLYLSKRHTPREAIGIDISAVAARRGWRLGIDLRQGEATRLPFLDKHLDCVVCVEALNYFDQEVFALEVRRVLKPSGRLAPGCGPRPELPSDVEAGASLAPAADRFGNQQAEARQPERQGGEADHPFVASHPGQDSLSGIVG